jgi:hypothetical protein
MLPANALFLRHKPSEVGQYPDGLKLPEPPSSAPHSTNSIDEIATEWTLKKAVLSGRFWAWIFFPFLSVVGVYIVLLFFPFRHGLGCHGPHVYVRVGRSF